MKVRYLSWVLIILSIFYSCVTKLRNLLYDLFPKLVTRTALPVISVGNITAGGNGKTPIVEFIVQRLKEMGGTPAVLLRGYKGTTSGPLLVSKSHTAREVGDEALMLAHRLDCPVYISKDRIAGVELIYRDKLASIVILDDGFQHRRLFRNLDILTQDLSNGDKVRDIICNRLLPYGFLREAAIAVKKRADILVLSHRGPRKFIDNATALRDCFPDTPIIESWIDSPKLLDSKGCEVISDKVVALCGIANPGGFLSTLEDAGYTVIHHHFLNDHQEIPNNLLSQLAVQFPNVKIVVTLKDYIKLDAVSKAKVCYLDFRLKIDNDGALNNLLMQFV